MIVRLQVIHLLCQAFLYGELILLYKILVVVDRELLIQNLPPVLVDFPVAPFRFSWLVPLLALLATRLSYQLYHFHAERDSKVRGKRQVEVLWGCRRWLFTLG